MTPPDFSIGRWQPRMPESVMDWGTEAQKENMNLHISLEDANLIQGGMWCLHLPALGQTPVLSWRSRPRVWNISFGKAGGSNPFWSVHMRHSINIGWMSEWMNKYLFYLSSYEVLVKSLGTSQVACPGLSFLICKMGPGISTSPGWLWRWNDIARRKHSGWHMVQGPRARERSGGRLSSWAKGVGGEPGRAEGWLCGAQSWDVWGKDGSALAHYLHSAQLSASRLPQKNHGEGCDTGLANPSLPVTWERYSQRIHWGGSPCQEHSEGIMERETFVSICDRQTRHGWWGQKPGTSVGKVSQKA